MIYRALRQTEYDLLKSFLYEAIYVPEGETPPDRSIVKLPELAVYYEGFGSRPDDCCMAAEDDGLVVGAAWTRIMDDYGHVDDDTPSLAMSVLKGYRGQGIGTRLLQEMTDLLKQRGYKKLSLSVQKSNFAVRMYEKAGFETVRENDEEYIMVCRLQQKCESSRLSQRRDR